jgi:hypothetical protein
MADAADGMDEEALLISSGLLTMGYDGCISWQSMRPLVI